GDVDRGTEGLTARVLEDDVHVVAAGELADLLPEPLPLPGVLLGPVLVPELVALGATVDDQLGPHGAADLSLLRGGDDADRLGAGGERHLDGIGAETTGGTPDEDAVAELERGAVLRDQLAVGGGVHQTGGGGLLPGEVVGLGHELVRLDDRQLGEAAEVRLEAPDALLRVHHRVVVAVRVLELDGEAVRDDLLPGLPLRDVAAGAQDDAGEGGAAAVVRSEELTAELQ